MPWRAPRRLAGVCSQHIFETTLAICVEVDPTSWRLFSAFKFVRQFRDLGQRRADGQTVLLHCTILRGSSILITVYLKMNVNDSYKRNEITRLLVPPITVKWVAARAEGATPTALSVGGQLSSWQSL